MTCRHGSQALNKRCNLQTITKRGISERKLQGDKYIEIWDQWRQEQWFLIILWD